MKIVKPYAKILDVRDRTQGIKLLKEIELYARVSHRSEDRVTDDSYDRFIRSVVLNHGDLSVIEHVKATVEAVVDRGITHEWVRHRMGSYTQESTRFVNYTKTELSFIEPPYEDTDEAITPHIVWHQAMTDAEYHYNAMINIGVPPQLARSVLPNSLASKIIVTYNLRSWRHFLIMRTTKETHPQMRQVTIPLLFEFQEKIPILFEDIAPEQKQSEAMRLLR